MNRKERQMKAYMETIRPPELSESRWEILNAVIAEESGKKVWIPRKSMAQRVWEQAAYISPLTWGFQLIFLLFGLYLLNQEMTGVMVKELAVLIPLTGIIAVPEFMKSFSRGMWELEESCFYNMRQLILLKMVIFGIADGLLITVLIAAAGSRGIRLTEAFYYIAVPFNLSNACYLFLFQLLKRRCSGYILAAAGCFMVAAGWMAQRYQLLDISRLTALLGPGTVWIAVGVSAAVLAGSVIRLLHGFEKEEGMIWSFE